MISLIDSIKSNVYDKYLFRLLTHERVRMLSTFEILELIEYLEPFNMPQNSVVLEFFINYCYPIFNKLEAKENITGDECELVCAVIVRYIQQIQMSSNIKIKQKLFINMDNLIEAAKEFVKNDNPNDLQSIYADNLLDYTSVLPLD